MGKWLLLYSYRHEFSAQTNGQQLWVSVIKSAIVQHPAVRHGPRFAVHSPFGTIEAYREVGEVRLLMSAKLK